MKEKKPQSLQCLISEGAFFDGELRFKGSARIAGQMQGRIRAEGSLVVEPSAQMEKMDVELDHLILMGEFRGRVKARKSVVMEPPAKFFGEVLSPSLSIKEGVLFEGVSKKAPTT